MSSDSSSYAHSDSDLAELLVSALFPSPRLDLKASYQVRLPDAPSIEELGGQDVYFADILEDAQEFRNQISMSEEHGLPVFCVESPSGGRPTPVSLALNEAELLVHPPRPNANPLSTLELVANIRISPSAKLVPYPPEMALGFYKAGLRDLFTARLAARSAGAKMVTKYNFDLTTKTAGLTAYWTFAGVLRRGQYFGHPTLKVSGSLPAGQYCFGAGLNGATATYDMTTYFDIPANDKGYINV